MIQALRVIRIGWLLQLKTMARSGFDVLTAIVTPITYATIAYFLYRRGGGGPETLLWVSLGAAFMGLWASTLWGAGNSDPAAALAADARVRDRRADTVPRLADRHEPRELDGRPLLARRHARLGTLPLRRPARARAPVPVRALAARGDALARPARDRDGGDADPLPLRVRAREHARVPDLARGRPARADRAPAGLGAADLLRAGADLGREGRARERASAASR